MHISDLCSVRSRLWVQSADIQFLSPHALQLDVVHRAGPTLVLAALALRPFLVLAGRLKASKSKLNFYCKPNQHPTNTDFI